jgi:hypothetical protein
VSLYVCRDHPDHPPVPVRSAGWRVAACAPCKRERQPKPKRDLSAHPDKAARRVDLVRLEQALAGCDPRSKSPRCDPRSKYVSERRVATATETNPSPGLGGRA